MVDYIGSDEWYSKLHTNRDLVEGKLLVNDKVGVYVSISSDDANGYWMFPVIFKGTSFWANAFDNRAEAIEYANEWNRRSGNPEVC